MAIIVPGAVVGGISGTIGGVNFVNARGSKVARKIPSTVSSTSLKSDIRRAIFSNLQKSWANRTAAEKQAWETFAANLPRANRLGQKRAISGYAQFMQTNTLRSLTDQDALTTPETPPLMAIPTSFTLTSSISGGISLTWPGSPVLPRPTALVYGVNLYRSTIPKHIKGFRFLGTELFSNSPGVLTLLWQEVFPLPILGQVIGVRIRPFNGTTLPVGDIVLSAITGI